MINVTEDKTGLYWPVLNCEKCRQAVWSTKEVRTMGYPEVVKHFEERGLKNEIILLDVSTATVDLAAAALGRQPGEIAKSLALEMKDGSVIVLVVEGTARIDNRKFKDTFSCKAKMLSFDDTLKATGHPVGGVCPFGLPDGIRVYLDESLKRHPMVFPAAGTPSSAVGFLPEELAAATDGQWVNVTKDPE